jgi:regulator of sirC expression with transglutaminase-like and TPR domain
MDDLTFADEIQSEPINVPRAALRLAKEIAYPDLDVATELERLDELAESARAFLSFYQTTIEQAESLGDFLFVQERFQGNAQDYADPRNSYLNEVLQRRLGIPISLSVIYIALAERLGIPAQGIGLPGHFVVGIPVLEDMYFIDPFHGGNRLAIEDCAQLVQQSTGYTGPLQRDWLQPLPAGAILTRMLNNLRNVYFQREDWVLAQSAVERLRLLQPDMPDLLRDLGLIYQHQGAHRKAIHFYEGYLTKVPIAPDARAVRLQLEEVVKNLAKLN